MKYPLPAGYFKINICKNRALRFTQWLQFIILYSEILLVINYELYYRNYEYNKKCHPKSKNLEKESWEIFDQTFPPTGYNYDALPFT